MKDIFDMISLRFKVPELISYIVGKDKDDILRLLESEAKEAEKISEIKGYGHDYVETLRGFVYFLKYQQKPYGIREEHFQIFRSVCEILVAKKQLSPDILKMFNSYES